MQNILRIIHRSSRCGAMRSAGSWERWDASLIPSPAWWVKDLALPQLQLGLQPWLRSDPWPANSICLEVAKNEKKKKRIIHSMQIHELFVDGWIKKMWHIYMYIYIYIYIHTHIIEYYLAVIKKEILPSVTIWMNSEDIMLSKISQTQKDKYCMISLIRNLRKKKIKLMETE